MRTDQPAGSSRLNLTLAAQDGLGDHVPSLDGGELKPRITVFGVGGAGGNAVNNMIDQQLEGVEFVVANTDAQALAQSRAEHRIQMGAKATQGLGAGAKPQIGAQAAEETIEEILDRLAGAHMCFITAGMGGGTGTGAAPIIAQAARELGILTVGVVTKPFAFEGSRRMRQAEEGIEVLQEMVDTLIIIPNQNLFRLANERTTFTEAFAMADDVLYQGVKGVTDLMVRPGLINLDFADVRAVMDEMGKAMMGTGDGEGEDRAKIAAEKAIANPLLDEISLEGAKGVLINITGGEDMTLFELDEAANIIRGKVDEDANIIVGSTLDPEMEGQLRVSVVATGIDSVASSIEPPRRKPAAEPVARRRAAPAPAPVAEVPEPVAARGEPAAAVAATASAEPSLFGAMEHELEADDRYAPVHEEVQDDLPPPAYQPGRVQAAATAATSVEPGSFVAPKPRVAGQPSPEALARLANAVRRVQPAAEAPAAEPAPERGSRFGINSLINRMTGHADGGAPRATAQPQMRRQPGAVAGSDPASLEQERLEIPAFLRRQAN